METKVFYVEKTIGTSADTLLAVGLASLVGHISREVHGTDDGIFINDAGSCYKITLPLPIDTHNLPRLRDMPVLLPLDTEKQREKLVKKGKEAQLDGFNYDVEMDKSRSYRERIKNLPPQLKTADARLRRAPELEGIIPDEPDTRLGHYQAISQMKIASSFNELVLRWRELTEEQMQLHVEILFKLFSNPDNDVTGTEIVWEDLAKKQKIPGKARVTALQIVNPTAGKGANRTKASELAIGNQDSFWLIELLKFVGFMDVAAPLVIKESKDRKTYVLQPKSIEFNKLQYMMHEFRAALWSNTAVKLDIIASLRLSQIFTKHHQMLYRYHKRRKSLNSIAHGFEVTFYKDMGSAYATMNLASINLPTWLLDMDNLENVKTAETLLKEHLEVIQYIRNSKGEEGAEEYELLGHYRDFLSGHDLRPFWQFTVAYSQYLISAREKNRYVQQFTTKGLEQLFMNNPNEGDKLSGIVTKEGFRHIADAIRQSTVSAQYRRAHQKDRTYEVRYTLGLDLMRKARYPKEFMTALCEFLYRYNAETAREREKVDNSPERQREIREKRVPGLRPTIASKDIDEVSILIDQHGSELIGSMLVAYGYAFDSDLISDNSTDRVKQVATANVPE